VSERYHVRVTKDYLVFCSGHFITYDGTECERLHGHNYRAAVEVEAPLDPNFYVFDFIALKNRMRELTDELDHRMMVATKNPILKVTESPALPIARRNGSSPARIAYCCPLKTRRRNCWQSTWRVGCGTC
jgi:6-pyruvoyl-tetrahydropterin synthase